MLGPKLRSMEKMRDHTPAHWGRKKLKISISSSSHSRPTLTRLTMILCFFYESPLFLNILSCEVKKRNECVIFGGGRGWGGDGVESCSIER